MKPQVQGLGYKGRLTKQPYQMTEFERYGAKWDLNHVTQFEYFKDRTYDTSRKVGIQRENSNYLST